MEIYQLQPDTMMGPSQTVKRLSDNAFIPFSPDNSDYQRFKLDIASGEELQDADGVVMTAEQVQAFLETLP